MITVYDTDTVQDHLVPLKEVLIFPFNHKRNFLADFWSQAWLSGARDWTDAQREAYANDLTRPQLVAVTDNLNESKGKIVCVLFWCSLFNSVR